MVHIGETTPQKSQVENPSAPDIGGKHFKREYKTTRFYFESPMQNPVSQRALEQQQDPGAPENSSSKRRRSYALVVSAKFASANPEDVEKADQTINANAINAGKFKN